MLATEAASPLPYTLLRTTPHGYSAPPPPGPHPRRRTTDSDLVRHRHPEQHAGARLSRDNGARRPERCKRSSDRIERSHQGKSRGDRPAEDSGVLQGRGARRSVSLPRPRRDTPPESRDTDERDPGEESDDSEDSRSSSLTPSTWSARTDPPLLADRDSSSTRFSSHSTRSSSSSGSSGSPSSTSHTSGEVRGTRLGDKRRGGGHGRGWLRAFFGSRKRSVHSKHGKIEARHKVRYVWFSRAKIKRAQPEKLRKEKAKKIQKEKEKNSGNTEEIIVDQKRKDETQKGKHEMQNIEDETHINKVEFKKIADKTQKSKNKTQKIKKEQLNTTVQKQKTTDVTHKSNEKMQKSKNKVENQKGKDVTETGKVGKQKSKDGKLTRKFENQKRDDGMQKSKVENQKSKDEKEKIKVQKQKSKVQKQKCKDGAQKSIDETKISTVKIQKSQVETEKSTGETHNRLDDTQINIEETQNRKRENDNDVSVEKLIMEDDVENVVRVCVVSIPCVRESDVTREGSGGSGVRRLLWSRLVRRLQPRPTVDASTAPEPADTRDAHTCWRCSRVDLCTQWDGGRVATPGVSEMVSCCLETRSMMTLGAGRVLEERGVSGGAAGRPGLASEDGGRGAAEAPGAGRRDCGTQDILSDVGLAELRAGMGGADGEWGVRDVACGVGKTRSAPLLLLRRLLSRAGERRRTRREQGGGGASYNMPRKRKRTAGAQTESEGWRRVRRWTGCGGRVVRARSIAV